MGWLKETRPRDLQIKWFILRIPSSTAWWVSPSRSPTMIDLGAIGDGLSLAFQHSKSRDFPMSFPSWGAKAGDIDRADHWLERMLQVGVLSEERERWHTEIRQIDYPLKIKQSTGKCPIIAYSYWIILDFMQISFSNGECSIFHCQVWLPERKPKISLTRQAGVKPDDKTYNSWGPWTRLPDGGLGCRRKGTTGGFLK